MKLNDTLRARLYALTAASCTIWLVQSIIESSKDGSLLAWTTIVFSASLLIVIGYTVFNAVKGWHADAEQSHHNGDSAS